MVSCSGTVDFNFSVGIGSVEVCDISYRIVFH